MAHIYFNNDSVSVKETYEDVSIQVYEANADDYPFIRLTIKDLEFNSNLATMEKIEREIQININQIVWFK